MDRIGLIVTINSFNKHFHTKTNSTICKSVEEARDELITYLCGQFDNLNIDFPDNINDFELIWFNREYTTAPCFTYKIFSHRWEEPWDREDIYNDVLTKMLEQDNKNPPNFDELYGEPTGDEENEDRFMMIPEENEEIRELEEKMKQIMKEAAMTDKSNELDKSNLATIKEESDSLDC
jgi:hypothetical protein